MGEARRRARDYTHSVPGRDDRLRSMSRASDFMPTMPAKPQAKIETAVDLLHGKEESHKIKKQRRSIWRQIRIPRPRTLAALAAGLLLLSGAGYGYVWWHKSHTDATGTPFTPGVMASVQFPLYYPTQMPSGFQIDRKSITEPQGGVVVFHLVDADGHIIYMSEEKRPTKFNLGGFYYSFDRMKLDVIKGGVIGAGYTNTSDRTAIASRTIDPTWIIADTSAQVTPDQLIKMLKSLKLSY